jgi:signal transduction histidine kinase/CheY-like chemotaxis protein
MMPNLPMRSSARLGELSRFLMQRRDAVAARLIAAVHGGGPLPNAGELSHAQLIDHLPKLFDELCTSLAEPPADVPSFLLKQDARQHGHFRWAQGYRLDEVVRELELLRRYVFAEVAEFFDGGSAGVRRAHQEEAAARDAIENLFSEIISNSVEQLIDEQDARLADSITERTRIESALRDSEERLRLATAAAGLGIFEWNATRRQAVWENARMYEITGQSPEDGPPIEEGFMHSLVHPDDFKLLTEAFVDGCSPGKQVSVVCRIHRKHDHALRWVEISGCWQFSEHGELKTFVGALADVTERQRAEDALRDSDRRKDHFLATLAHELRNPLAPIRHAAEAIKRLDDNASPQQRWACKVIERQSNHLSRLVEDLLDVSRITTGKVKLRKRRVELHPIVSAAVEISRPHIAARRHRFKLTLPADPVYVDGDPTRLTQVITNLLDNAAKYTDDGGEIRLVASSACGHVTISVEDTGVGIRDVELPHVFDLFTQAHALSESSRGGLGIGLSVVQSLVRLHGGTVAAASDGPGKGSRFTVRLPLSKLAAEPEFAPVPVMQLAAPPLPAPLRVLVVDDNVDAAESLAMLLSLDGLEVKTAHDGLGALAAAAEFAPHVAILDIGLPGMSGNEVALQLREMPQTRDTVLVALTGYGQPDDIKRSADAGFQHHLVKPVEPDALARLLRTFAPGTRDAAEPNAPAGP